MAHRAPLESLPRPTTPDARARYLSVPRTRFLVPGLILFVLLMLLEVRSEKMTDFGLQRLTNQWMGTPAIASTATTEDTRTTAQRLGVSEQMLLDAQYVIEQHFQRLETERRNYWNRLIVVEGQEYRYFIGYRFFLNLAGAIIFGGMMMLRRRAELAVELLDYQSDRFTRVYEALEQQLQDTRAVADKFEKLQSKLVAAEKFASIGRLSATLAHEIRNPLTIIKSSTEIVEDGLEKGSGSAAALILIRDEINRLDRIISDLLNFARPKAPKLERVWLKNTVRHWFPPVVEELEKERIQLVPQLEVDGEVLVDPDQLYQVFLNLMWNARDALRGHPNPHIFVKLEDGGDRYLALTVQDTGMGMLPEVLAQVKEPFFTTKASGSGLGIPVSVQLVESMGGKFRLESEVEFGTTVTLLLPRVGAPAPSASESGVLTAQGQELPPQRDWIDELAAKAD